MIGGMVKGAISSIKEGGGALAESVQHAVEGDWDEAGKDFARAGLEAGGAALSVAMGPGAEVAQETIEGALDNAVLERRTGDVPGPGGPGADWSIDNLFEGAMQGATDSTLSVFGGIPGGKQTLSKVLGSASSQQGGGALRSLLASGAEGSTDGLFGALGDVASGTEKMNRMRGSARRANDRVRNTSI